MSNGFFKNVGIDSIGFYTPRFYLNLDDLAKNRKVDPKKFRDGLLLHEMRIPDPNEDCVTMSVKAAQNAIIRGQVDPKTIDAIFVGTETITYAVKSVSNILADILGVSPNSITQDIYNACAGATLAILNAISMIENGLVNKALVIGVDISSYDMYSPGEPTQGAGAVALILTKNPRIAAFSHKFGKVSGNVNDFYRAAGQKNAKVFGKYSVDSYLNFQMAAFDDLNKHVGEIQADYYAFHAPFSKLPVKFVQKMIVERSQHFVNYILNSNPKPPRSRLTSKLPSIRYSIKHFPSLISKILLQNGYSRSVIDTVLQKASHYREHFFPHLKVPMHFGNMYSASVWAQINYILENHSHADDVIYFGSYGSGATCISGLLKVMPNYDSVLQNYPKVEDYIQNKVRRTYQEYELIKTGKFQTSLSFGHIVPHEKNNNRGFELHYCDEGCLIASHEGLNRCPQGHSGNHKIFYPLYALLTTDPIENYDFSDTTPLFQGNVRILGKPKKGMLLEYDMRRVQIKIKDPVNGEGLLNWVPTYMPNSHTIF